MQFRRSSGPFASVQVRRVLQFAPPRPVKEFESRAFDSSTADHAAWPVYGYERLRGGQGRRPWRRLSRFVSSCLTGAVLSRFLRPKPRSWAELCGSQALRLSADRCRVNGDLARQWASTWA